MKNISLNIPIDISMFLYIVSLYLYNDITEKTIYCNILAFLLMLFIWLKFIITKRNLIINNLLKLQLGFIMVCSLSYYIAIDSNIALEKIITLTLIFLLMVSLVNYIDSYKKLRRIMLSFIFASLYVSINILLNSNFSDLTRFGSEFGNANAVGMGIAIGAVFCFYIMLSEKKRYYALGLVVMMATIFLTGSRKAILFILLNIFIMLYLENKESFKSLVKFLIVCTVLAVGLYYLIFTVPIFYEILGKRMEDLLAFLIGKGTNEGSINERALMIKFGFQMFKNEPLIGYGIDNFRILFGRVYGNWTYSHNNYIELMVDTGLLGVGSYYLTHVVVVKELIKTSKIALNKSICRIFISIIISYTFLSSSLVYYDSKHFSILIVLASCAIKISQFSINSKESGRSEEGG